MARKSRYASYYKAVAGREKQNLPSPQFLED